LQRWVGLRKSYQKSCESSSRRRLYSGQKKEEYINILHLGGSVSKIGDVRHIFRDDKLLVGFYTFTKDDPIAEAAAMTLAGDETGEWGGSIEFLHYGRKKNENSGAFAKRMAAGNRCAPCSKISGQKAVRLVS
jgi:hypothetical protein